MTEYDVKVNTENIEKTRFDVEIRFQGEASCNRRYYFNDQTQEEMAQYCKKLIADDYVNAVIDTVILKNTESPFEPLILNFKFTVSNAVQQQGDLYFMNTDPFVLFSDLGWLAKERRSYPIYFRYPYMVKKKITLSFARDKFTVRNLPKDIKQVDENLFYSKQFSYDQDKTVTSTEMFSITSNQVYADRYKEARNFFENIKNKMNEKMVFVGPQ